MKKYVFHEYDDNFFGLLEYQRFLEAALQLEVPAPSSVSYLICLLAIRGEQSRLYLL